LITVVDILIAPYPQRNEVPVRYVVVVRA
jgi:hypothetical protein